MKVQVIVMMNRRKYVKVSTIINSLKIVSPLLLQESIHCNVKNYWMKS